MAPEPPEAPEPVLDPELEEPEPEPELEEPELEEPEPELEPEPEFEEPELEPELEAPEPEPEPELEPEPAFLFPAAPPFNALLFGCASPKPQPCPFSFATNGAAHFPVTKSQQPDAHSASETQVPVMNCVPWAATLKEKPRRVASLKRGAIVNFELVGSLLAWEGK